MLLMNKDAASPNYAEIARRLGCDYRTAKKYFETDGTKVERRKKPSKLDNFYSIIENKVDEGCTFKSIFHFIVKKGFEGKYTIVREYCKAIKIDKTNKATIRFEASPGIQAQVDWKESLKMISKEGEVFEINIFLMILGYSRTKYMQLTLDRNQDTLMTAMVNGFKYFGGVPKEILFDNMRTVVDQAKSNYQHAVINAPFYEFSKDMGFEVIACRPYRPETKGKVEALAKLTSRLKVYNHEFSSIEQLTEIVTEVNEDLNNEISTATNKKPRDLLPKEKEYLLLPNLELLNNHFSKPISWVVTKEAMVTYLNNKYSLHPNYIAKTVFLKVDNNILSLIYEGVGVATHQITNKKFNYLKDHYTAILKSDALRHKSDHEIEKLALENLKLYDKL